MKSYDWKCANCHKPITENEIEVSVERSFGSLRTAVYTTCCNDDVVDSRTEKDVSDEIIDALTEDARIARRGY